MTSDPDDAELIARSLDGDEDAFVEVVRRHEAAVGAYLARRAGRDLAEDLLGEVWVAALASRVTYDRSFPDAGPRLFGVAHNTLRRYWRSRPAEEPVADMTGMASGWDPWAAVDSRVDTESVLRQALALLRPEQREIVTLVTWEDLTVADAGRVLGLPPGTARRCLHEARMALRTAPGMAALLADQNTVKEATDNFIWMNSLDALTAAPENAQVRAGVLRIMATTPNVKVTPTTTAGQPTLTLADSWPELGDPGLVESLVINASTGFPVALFNRDPGQPLNATYYHTSRVTLADLEAGQF